MKEESKIKLDLFLKHYAKIQLYIFMICLSIPLILYILVPSSFSYEIDYNDCAGDMFCEAQAELISTHQGKVFKNKIYTYGSIGSLCILGMIIFNEDSRAKIKKLFKKIDGVK